MMGANTVDIAATTNMLPRNHVSLRFFLTIIIGIIVHEFSTITIGIIVRYFFTITIGIIIHNPKLLSRDDKVLLGLIGMSLQLLEFFFHGLHLIQSLNQLFLIYSIEILCIASH